ncbi:hypothetical protein ACMTAU_05180, partial [Alcaligenes pakistanensis]
ATLRIDGKKGFASLGDA